jgi:hypothetical protein
MGSSPTVRDDAVSILGKLFVDNAAVGAVSTSIRPAERNRSSSRCNIKSLSHLFVYLNDTRHRQGRRQTKRYGFVGDNSLVGIALDR